MTDQGPIGEAALPDVAISFVETVHHSGSEEQIHAGEQVVADADRVADFHWPPAQNRRDQSRWEDIECEDRKRQPGVRTGRLRLARRLSDELSLMCVARGPWPWVGRDVRPQFRL